tara:strand:- start:74 stop:499 length:426 start_codon:yes stop_codon:yes gene_type:complete
MSSFELLSLDMLFKNRKRVVLDRGPSWPDYDKAEPFMVRYYLLFRKRPKWFPFNILVHQLLKSDLGDLHDHYWSYITIILKGGYWETSEKGTFWRGPGYIGFRKSTDRHSLKIEEGKSTWTLLLVGPNRGSKQHAKYQKNS